MQENIMQQLTKSQFGWSEIADLVSTVTWSLSFYGQIYVNYKCQSVQGFALDYLVLNMVGYAFYGIYTTIGYFTDIQGAGTVLLGDLLFVYHAIPLVILMAVQCWYYPKGKNKISIQAIIIGVVLWVIVIAEIVFTVFIPLIQWSQYWNPVSVMGYGKIVISFIKYTPSAYWNYKRKSTKGWSIFGMITDLIGGSLSLASGGASVENGYNVTKVLLAVLTIIYDLIFIFQHYVLYRQKPQKKKKGQVEQSLLSQQIKSQENFQKNSNDDQIQKS